MIEIGVYSLAIDQQLGWSRPPPKNPHCHWREEIEGNITHPGFEYWWDVTQYDSVAALTEAVRDRLLHQAIPDINHHITDEQLKAHWLTGGGGGLSELMTLKMLSILLKSSDEKEKLEEILHKTEEKYGHNKRAMQHIKKMKAETLQESVKF